MPRASRRSEAPPAHLVPDVLGPDLDLVFCGTAPSPISFRRRAYYANPGNSFWSTLHRVGLLPERLEPERYREVLRHGIGLTDLNKTEYGSDHELTPAALDAAAMRAKLLAHRPAGVAFTSKNAGGLFFGVRGIGYGRQPPALVSTLEAGLRDIAYFVLASPSGRARSWWRIEPWQEVAAFVEARRRGRA
ncbi:MAG: mismatch-specific DNA-glycosylase [Alphaproteobacteria bacterium]|nr:mismatch-specific DNA-glycosylase [Alphaproteobacteria bacterium]MCW5743281.1 mismatch-specific DNA-glycosylase [Alphaproteobacteria bacterium]